MIMRRIKENRRGQTIVLFMMVLVALALILFWVMDLHRILHIKSRSTTAGDSAALAAARFQALTLNLVGELNIMQAVALCNDDAAAANTIADVQARLCFTGPMTALVASQIAAKNNHIFANDDFTEELNRHADEVEDYDTYTGSGMLFPEPYPGAWQEYADMIRAVATEEVAAAPDNASYYTDRGSSHTLLSKSFYDAVAAQNWCWFYNHAPSLLESYRNFFPCWWNDLPPLERRPYTNCEYFGLGLAPLRVALIDITSFRDLSDAASEQGLESGLRNNTNLTETVATWYVYGNNWGSWSAIDVYGSNPFPLVGPVKPQYNYSGADAVTRVLAGLDRISPSQEGGGSGDQILWTAAAKPFGYLEDEMLPTSLNMVVPAYRDIRLIPVDASSGGGGGAFDLEWRFHTDSHLPPYMDNGTAALKSGCYYCAQLRTWEQRSFRQSGIAWLNLYSDKCESPAGGGGGGGGGGGDDGGDTRRGH